MNEDIVNRITDVCARYKAIGQELDDIMTELIDEGVSLGVDPPEGRPFLAEDFDRKANTLMVGLMGLVSVLEIHKKLDNTSN